jgi:hypothetical protein
MLAALAASGQTPSAFARAKGFPLHRVSYWSAKLAGPERQEPLVHPGKAGFVPVAVRDALQRQEDTSERRVEVALPNGRVVTFTGTWEATAIAPWLHALEGER